MLVNLLGQWCLESQVKNLQAKKADSKQKYPKKNMKGDFVAIKHCQKVR